MELAYHLPPPPPLSLITRDHHHQQQRAAVAFPKAAIKTQLSSSIRNPNYKSPKLTKLAVTGVTVAACFLTRFKVKPAIAAPPPPPPPSPSTVAESEDEGIIIIIKKDEYHQLKELEKQIAERLELYQRRRFDHRSDLKLMLVCVRLIQGEYKEALKMYQDLCSEDSRDFKPYLTRAIIYTLLGKNNEAEISLKMADKVRIGLFLTIDESVRIGIGLVFLIFQIYLVIGANKLARRRKEGGSLFSEDK